MHALKRARGCGGRFLNSKSNGNQQNSNSNSEGNQQDSNSKFGENQENGQNAAVSDDKEKPVSLSNSDKSSLDNEPEATS